jgi:ribosomal protein L23
MNILFKPIITYKSIMLIKSFNIYSFFVSINVTKRQIKQEVEFNYKVKVEEVRTIICGKKKITNYQIRKNSIKKFYDKNKKALIKIKKGQYLYF